MNERRTPLGAAGSISLATAVSRVLGLVRDQVQSFYFGAGVVTDAYFAAFRIPNLLRDLFAEGALSAAFVPTFTLETERRGLRSAWKLASRLITLLAVVLGVVALAIVLFAPWILRAYAPGFSETRMSLAVTMVRILSPFLLFVALAAVAMGMLNTRGRFFLPALSPASFNVCAILGVVLLYPVFRRVGLDPGLSLAVGAVTGGALQFLVQVPALRREGFRFRPDLAPGDPGVRRVMRLMLPATFGLAATQVNIFVDTVMASFLTTGPDQAPITWLSLAFRLMQLPLGLFGVAIATANLTYVSRDAARGDMDGLRGNLAASLRAAALLTLPATAGLIALREPIVRVLFEHGEFTPLATAKTAAAVLCYAMGLYAYSVTKIQVPTFYALGDTRLPVIASATAVGVKIVANLVLVAVLPLAGIDAFLGLALSTALAAWTNFLLLSVGIRRRVGELKRFRVVSATVKLAGISIGMGAFAAGFHAGLETFAGGGGLPGDAARLLGAVAAGVAITVLGVQWAGPEEGRALLARVRRFLRGG